LAASYAFEQATHHASPSPAVERPRLPGGAVSYFCSWTVGSAVATAPRVRDVEPVAVEYRERHAELDAGGSSSGGELRLELQPRKTAGVAQVSRDEHEVVHGRDRRAQ